MGTAFDYFRKQHGNPIGIGRDGEVYVAVDDEEAVVKVSLQPINEDLLAELQATNPSHFATIHSFGSHLFSCSGEDSAYGKWYGCQAITVVRMERLYALTADEAKVFHSIVSHEDANRTKVFSPEQLNDILAGLALGLEFDIDRVREFYWAAMTGDIAHGDMHPRNVMKTKDGRFKFVDLDRLHKQPPTLPYQETQ